MYNITYQIGNEVIEENGISETQWRIIRAACAENKKYGWKLIGWEKIK